MSRNGRVIVAMSGGVDSSVAACMLKEQGYDAVGVFMRVGTAPERQECSTAPAAPGRSRSLKHGCCSASDAEDARAVAGKLGIPFYALNFEAEFERIIDYFVDEYAAARTPNPCVLCNIHLKFGRLLAYADMLDAAFVATGHYARIVPHAAGPRLARAVNRAKDQSYVLFGVRRADLPRCLFPLGEIADKAETRRMAAGLRLRVHDKPDSQEICFVPDNNYRELVRARRPQTLRKGTIRDERGAALAEHDGVSGFTVGQRRGLGIATGTPRYVTRLDVLTNTVTVGPREALFSPGLRAERVNWLVDAPPIGTTLRCDVKIRHTHSPAPACVTLEEDGGARATFDEPQLAVTPGQAAVFYGADDSVLAGGWIGSSERVIV
jgi:tRNA-specific 2-thiouridylase